MDLLNLVDERFAAVHDAVVLGDGLRSPVGRVEVEVRLAEDVSGRVEDLALGGLDERFDDVLADENVPTARVFEVHRHRDVFEQRPEHRRFLAVGPPVTVGPTAASDRRVTSGFRSAVRAVFGRRRDQKPPAGGLVGDDTHLRFEPVAVGVPAVPLAGLVVSTCRARDE
jgi:hypothetical protein